MRLLLAHGWALDRALWDAVLAALGDDAAGAVALDAGYYGRPAGPPSAGGPFLGVGQSLGALELLAAPPAPLAGLVVLDGFARFGSAEDFAQGQPARVLDRMARRLDSDAAGGVDEFLGRAFPMSARPPGLLDAPRLAEGLKRLQTLDGRPAVRRLPLWRLHAEADPIAPGALADASFAEAGDVRQDLRRRGSDHLSPLSAPAACADLIRQALRELGS